MNTNNSINHDRFRADFTAALLKVASRCNLDCDYCYVYHHIDQTWRSQPKLMKPETIRRFGWQLNKYVADKNLRQFSVIFHGGEPLLFSANGLAKAREIIQNEIATSCELDFSVQTNGHLLTDDALYTLEQAQIDISLSLDGPRHVNDLHRLDHTGKSSFDGTFAALQRLIKASSDIFQGVISVIDPSVPPIELFEFFSQFDLPRLDFLLPDATHVNLPHAGISLNAFQDWLNEAFELWYRDYSELQVRFFDAILGSRLSVPSPTDALGFGAVNLIVIETDGSYTDHDVFKIAKEGVNHLQNNVETTGFESLSTHPKIIEHGFRLSPDGVADECKACPVLEACGGGSVMHRYHNDRGFDAPTVYCQEMFSLLSTATRLLRSDLSGSNETAQLLNISSVLSFTENLVEYCRDWRILTERSANEIAGEFEIENREPIPAAALIMRKNFLPLSLGESDGFTYAEPQNMWLGSVRIQLNEPWLSKSFADSIRVISLNSDECRHGIAMLELAESYLSAVSPFLPLALAELISDIMFVESTIDEEAGIFSFSDDGAPNVLYIAPYAGGQLLAPDDMADSILHEFLHHVLYHIELSTPLLFDYDYPQLPAPWRAGFRPAGGFLHGTFVFSGLALFWKAIAALDHSILPMYNKNKAVRNAKKFRAQAIYGLRSTYQFSLLTPSGIEFVEQIAEQLDLASLDMTPPGILH